MNAILAKDIVKTYSTWLYQRMQVTNHFIDMQKGSLIIQKQSGLETETCMPSAAYYKYLAVTDTQNIVVQIMWNTSNIANA